MSKKQHPSKDSDFLRLRKKWYGLLKRRGFEDIEFIDWKTGDSGNLLRGITERDVRRYYSPEGVRYYELARQFLWTLKPGLDRRIWKLHSEGVSTAKIARKLHIGRRRATEIVARLAAEVRAGALGEDETEEDRPES